MVGVHGEVIAGVGGNHGAILSPVGEGVVGVGRSRDGASLSFSVRAATCDGATIGWVGRHTNGVGLRDVGEVGHKGMVGVHGEAIAGVGGNHGAILGPVGEGVVGVGRGSDGTRLSFIVSSSTRDSATIGWVGRNTDGIALGLL